VIGAGQAGLAAGYHLRQAGRTFVILESQAQPGGSWQFYYESLKLFSPRRFSSLPGLPFPGDPDAYPNRADAVAYLRQFASHFSLPIQCDAAVESVQPAHDGSFEVHGSRGQVWHARNVIAASGAFRRPSLPQRPGRDWGRGRGLRAVE
jgi:putative flavoprotein involved in K+ transport